MYNTQPIQPDLVPQSFQDPNLPMTNAPNLPQTQPIPAMYEAAKNFYSETSSKAGRVFVSAEANRLVTSAAPIETSNFDEIPSQQFYENVPIMHIETSDFSGGTSQTEFINEPYVNFKCISEANTQTGITG